MSSPTTATAWQYGKRGNLSQTLESKQVQIPAPKSGEVLVKVYAAALNPVDWKIAALMPGWINKLPHTAAADFAGQVVTIGSDTDIKDKPWLKQGARVYGALTPDETMKSGGGSLSTFLLAKTVSLSLIPEGLSYIDASGYGICGTTAATMVSKMKKQDRVLVLGGTTSVGLYLLQMCREEQASLIVATSSKEKASSAKQAGADEIVDYRSEDAETILKERYGSNPFDVIFDCVGSFKTFAACASYLKKDGIYLNVGASDLDPNRTLRSGLELAKNTIWYTLRPRLLGGTPRKYLFSGRDNSYISRMADYVTYGKIKPWTDSVFSFEEAPKAYAYLGKGRALGKVVVKVQDE